MMSICKPLQSINIKNNNINKIIKRILYKQNKKNNNNKKSRLNTMNSQIRIIIREWFKKKWLVIYITQVDKK